MDNAIEDGLTRNRKAGLRRLMEVAGTKKWWLVFSVLTTVIATMAQFVPVIIIYEIIIELASHAGELHQADKAYLFKLAYIGLGFVAVFGVLKYLSLMLSHIAAFNILYEIRLQLAEKLPRLSLGFFSTRTSGEIKKIISEDVERIEVFVAHNLVDITNGVIFPLIMVGYLFHVDWRLGLATLVPLPLSFIIQFAMMADKESVHRYHKAMEQMNTAVVEYVRGIQVVKIFNGGLDSYKNLTKSIFTYRDTAHRITHEYSLAYPLFLTIISSSLVFILPVSLMMLSAEGQDLESLIPKVFLFLIVGGGLFFPLLKLMRVNMYMREINLGMERIDTILYQADLPLAETLSDGCDLKPTIEFSKVCFAYEEQQVLDHVSFVAEENTVTALVGPSGAGKTTIGLLVARFWDVTAGKIAIDGVDVRNLKPEILMDLVSFVFQDEFLFFDTIEENIRMGHTQAGMDEVINAAKAAQCHDFISQLPQGYNTRVGQGGTYLSGGEKQRIGLARVILKDAPIAVLDEATAYVDPENEGKMLKALANAVRGKTVLVIAHRLSTITEADQILVINQGRIVQQGKHRQLVSEPGLYRTMWETYSQARGWVINSGEKK